MKILKVFCILSATIILAACSGKEAIQTNNNQPKEAPKNSTPAVAEATPTPKPIVPTEEILNAPMYKNIVQLGDTIITLPTTLDEILKLGAEFGEVDKNENSLVDGKENTYVSLKIGNSKFSVNLTNLSEKAATLKECQVTKISSSGTEVFFPGGIACGNSFETLKDKWGEPASEDAINDELVYEYSDYPFRCSRLENMRITNGMVSATGYTYVVKVNKNKGIISDISYEFPSETAIDLNWETQSERVIRYKNMGGQTVTFNYSFPKPLTINRAIARDNVHTGVLSAEDNDYIVVATLSFLSVEIEKNPITDDMLLGYVTQRNHTSSKILFNDGVNAAIVAYNQENNAIKSIVYWFLDGRSSTTEIDIYTFDESDNMSEEARVFFEELVESYASSISMTIKD